MPYRIDLHDASDDALDRLVELGALDIEPSRDGGIAALLPDAVTPRHVARVLAIDDADVAVTPAVGRDGDSVWVLSPRAIRVGGEALKLIDAPVFGTGLHPTTAMCLEWLDERTQVERPDDVLDVGTGSGVLALAALRLGVPRATAIDIDDDAVRAAAENARINGLEDRLTLARGGPETIAGTWPLVLANVLAAPLIEMAPALVRRVGHHGQLLLSGIASSLEHDVDRAYRHLGMTRVRRMSRAGWIALVMRASW